MGKKLQITEGTKEKKEKNNMRSKAIQSAVEYGVKGIKNIMKPRPTPGQMRREEVGIITGMKPQSPLDRMDDSAKQAFARQNLK